MMFIVNMLRILTFLLIFYCVFESLCSLEYVIRMSKRNASAVFEQKKTLQSFIHSRIVRTRVGLLQCLQNVQRYPKYCCLTVNGMLSFVPVTKVPWSFLFFDGVEKTMLYLPDNIDVVSG